MPIIKKYIDFTPLIPQAELAIKLFKAEQAYQIMGTLNLKSVRITLSAMHLAKAFYEGQLSLKNKEYSIYILYHSKKDLCFFYTESLDLTQATLISNSYEFIEKVISIRSARIKDAIYN